MAVKIIYSCQNCGYSNPKWMGKCPDCGTWDSLVEESVAETSGVMSKTSFLKKTNKPVAFSELRNCDFQRITTDIKEFDRVLGGGIVKGSLVLLGGEPGIGKSTLLLQVSASLAEKGEKVLYISGEESENQLKMRGERLGLSPDSLLVLGETNIETIFEWVDKIEPSCIIIDSIQTVFSTKLPSAPGSVSQLREASTQFLFLAKNRGIPLFLIGHVTKEGSIAGPKAMEHIVDSVLYFEGDRNHLFRIVRAVKNRFGPANELALFEMTGTGLCEVDNPSRAFLEERPVNMPGSSVFCKLEGSRPLLVEIQALVSSTNYGTARRMAIGIDHNRMALLLAVLEKKMGYSLQGSDVFVNVTGGITINEPAADIAIISAVASSFEDKPIDSEVALFGEVGLSGELRGVVRPEVRLKEIEALGFSKCVVPEANRKAGHGKVELNAFAKMEEALNFLMDR